MKYRIAAFVLCIAMVLGLLPAAAAEELHASDLGSTPVELDICDGSISIVSGTDTVAYTQGDEVYTSTGGCIVTQSDTSGPAANRIDISAAEEDALEVKLTIAGLNVESEESPIALDGSASVILTLVGENVLTCTGTSYSNSNQAGLCVTQYAALTVKGSGSLSATGGYQGAGIGGGYSGDGGTITISGGEVTAIGGQGGAGIGGGKYGNGGTITITGGMLNATSGNAGVPEGSGAGVGGGYFGDGGVITISGGIVTATGGSGAGIGGGYNGDGGNIFIIGGSVTAFGGTFSKTSTDCGSGIGGGKDGSGGAIFLSNSEITAKGYYHAIGGGSMDNAYGCDCISSSESVVLNLSYTHRSSSGTAGGSLYQERIDTYKMSDSAAHIGNDAIFSVDAYGYSGITYQWQRKDGYQWIDMEGQASATSAIPVAEDTVGSSYRCKITNVYGNTVYTDSVKSYILAFTQQPESVETNLDEIAALTVTSSCSNVTYQWQRSYDRVSWTDVAGKNSPTLVVTTTHSENGAWYRCVITATNGDELASDPAQIIVNTNVVTYTTHYYLENADGSYSLADRTVLEGQPGAAVTAPEKTFEHYEENTAMGVHSGTVAEDGSLTLSRYYSRVAYTLTFETNGGSALPAVTAKHGTALSLPQPTWYGHTFDGWYLDQDFTERAVFTLMPTADTTVYAKWTAVGEGRGTEYLINGISLRGEDYQPVEEIPAAPFYAEVSVTNLSSVTTDTLVLAAYDGDGRMLDMWFMYSNPAVGQTVVLGTLVDNSGGEIAILRAYMLPMLGGFVPLARSVSVGADV